MDRSRYKRPDIQTQRQTTKIPFGNPQPVPKVVPPRTHAIRPLAPHVVAKPPVRQTAPTTNHIAARPNLAHARPHTDNRLRARKPVAAPVTATMAAPAPASKLPIDMDLPGEESPWHLAGAKGRSRWSRMRLFASKGVAIALILVITLGGLLFSQSYLKLHKVFKGSAGTAEALKADVKPELLKGEGRGRVNVLLLGRGGGTHDAPDLTDTLMVASVDPVNHTTILLSVPRDLWVNVPGAGVMKLNAAWQTGAYKYLGKVSPGSNNPKATDAGFKLVDQTIGEALGIDIDYNMLVNFQAFKQAVDTVGGVTVNVGTDLVDPTMAWENNNDPVLAHAGVQNFDGSKALIYSRSRETSSDFARGERQRSVLMALKTKVATVGTLSNPAKLAGLINSFGNNVQTDLSIKNAQRLYGIVKGVGDSKVGSISLASDTDSKVTTGNINGQSVVLPKAGLFNYADIQQYVRSQLKDPYIMKEKAKIAVLNGTLVPGLATTKAEELKTYGYNVTFTGNTPSGGWTQTTLVDMTHKNKYTKNYLEKRFNQKAASSLADSTIATNGADFVIIIGSNETSTTPAQAN